MRDNFSFLKKNSNNDLIEILQQEFNRNIGDKNLAEWGKYIGKTNSTAFKVTHSGTLFKLFSLYSYLLYTYLPIMRNWRSISNSRKLLYIDIFCGNGLNKLTINGKETFVCGSAILTLFASHRLTQNFRNNYFFDNMLLIDRRENNIDLLKQRCDHLISELNLSNINSIDTTFNTKSKINFVRGNLKSDSFVNRIISHIEDYWSKNQLIHIMFFIDPGSPPSLRMSTLRSLLVYPGDLIMLLHPGIFAEMVKKKKYKDETLKEMLDLRDYEINKLNRFTVPQLQKLYVDRYINEIRKIEIRKITKGSPFREIITPVHIRTKSSYYVLIYATRKTGGPDYEKWQETFKKFAEEIGKLSNLRGLILNILSGEQKQIPGFFDT